MYTAWSLASRMFSGRAFGSSGFAMTWLTRYMNRIRARTVQIEAIAKCRPGAGLPHAERRAAGHTRATKSTTATSCVSR